jgi:shikimate kinase
MKLALIGMSNVGKTLWSHRLEQHGFQRYSCDDMIETKLSTELQTQGFAGIADVARWMGHPYDEQYPLTSALYLSFERQSLEEIIEILSDPAYNTRDIVVDTTGSVIYLGEDILRQLGELTTVVYLETPEDVQHEMMQNFFRNPKPLIWGDSFSVKQGESYDTALKRCYPLLLKERTNKYQEYADVVLEYHTLRQPTFTIHHFLDIVSTV